MAEPCCNWQKVQEVPARSSAFLDGCPGRNSINPKYQNGSWGTKGMW